MLAKGISSLALLILVPLCLTSAATETDLQLGKAEEGTLSAGKADSYVLTLRSGDLVETNVVTHGTKLLVTVYGPSGSKTRGFRFNGPGRKIDFVAEDPGRYRLEVAINGKANDGPYTITLMRIIALMTQAPVAEKYESPRIKALRTALDGGQQNAVATFWNEVKDRGAPLIEPLEGDEKNMLVTFLWRGTADTKNVGVVWFPFSLYWPDNYQMSRLGETDIWCKTVKVDKRKRFNYQLALNAPPLHASQEPVGDDTYIVLEATSRLDPLNPKHWLADPESPDAPQYQGVSVVEMPDAPVQPWLAQRQGIPAGSVEKHQFDSVLLKNTREVAVYIPPGYSKDAKPYGLIVLFDERAYLNDKAHGTIVPTPIILDNLIAEKRIPPLIALLIDNPSGDTRSRELPCNTKFEDFLSFELLPWAHRSYNITSDPSRTVVGGASYGGLAAACAGLYHSETFGNILSQSGSYWWTPPRSDNPNDFDPAAEPNWVAKQFIVSPKLPLRFYLDAGSDEVDYTGRGGDILVTSRHLRDILIAKGYEVHYQEFSGGHDFLSWRGTLADGLILLMGTNLDREQASVYKH
jgi:enterochelin esterase-like enzyme